MRDMGEAAVETLLGAVRLPMKKLVDTSLQTRPDVALYEHATSSLYTVKAVVVLPPYDVLELLALLDMRSTESFRHTMRILLDGVFVDGAVLHATPPSSPHSAESMTLNWLAVQNAKVHLPNRDYVFLKYGNCYALCGQCSPRRPAFMPTTSSTPSRPLKDTVAVSVWESVDVTECGPLPNDLNTLRLHFRQTGYVLEYMPRSRDASHGICISFFMSEEVPSSRSVSSLGKAWVVRMAQSVANLHHALVHQYVAEGRQRQLDMPRPMKPTAASRCHCCSKRFSILRRRHPCHLCSELVCKRCLDKQFQVDLCATCRLPSSMSLFKYWAS
ncbi:hypothetical protein DYB32_009618 [Aphanomyces invadans]|uniref:FYVE-type domain-containing protein n=1 Tax=Aphanomyces invadans TaxID=157072 RepID=A0A3R6V4V4_9STRA|nr:hypothetical protein DYB32_009618 [Aphanomyces invadans]